MSNQWTIYLKLIKNLKNKKILKYLKKCILLIIYIYTHTYSRHSGNFPWLKSVALPQGTFLSLGQPKPNNCLLWDSILSLCNMVKLWRVMQNLRPLVGLTKTYIGIGLLPTSFLSSTAFFLSLIQVLILITYSC